MGVGHSVRLFAVTVGVLHIAIHTTFLCLKIVWAHARVPNFPQVLNMVQIGLWRKLIWVGAQAYLAR